MKKLCGQWNCKDFLKKFSDANFSYVEQVYFTSLSGPPGGFKTDTIRRVFPH